MPLQKGRCLSIADKISETDNFVRYFAFGFGTRNYASFLKAF